MWQNGEERWWIVAGVTSVVIALGTYMIIQEQRKKKQNRKERQNDFIHVTCTAPINMAVIKYWGKRDEKLNLPLNSSLSTTLHQDDLKTTTTIVASKTFAEDEIWLNGKKEDIQNPRIQKCLKEIRERATTKIDKKTGQVIVSRDDWINYKVKIVSTNNFPTAAGLASSASGYCCLVYALAELFGVQGDISVIARQGSGSACRSIYGGFVAWEMGEKTDGSDSRAVQIATENHWPELQILVLVVQDKKKETSSTKGMQQSAKTSKLLEERAKNIVPKRMIEMTNAIRQRDFTTFADLTMRDSDSFHDVCADTNPPIFYLNDISRSIISLVKNLNEKSGRIMAAYTFDAGPNAVIYALKQDLPTVLGHILSKFPSSKPENEFLNKPYLVKESVRGAMIDDAVISPKIPDGLKYILHTSVGPKPQILGEESSLIDLSTGNTKN